jgi:predicted nucleic acid-binding protein
MPVLKLVANITVHNHRCENLISYINETGFSANTGKCILQENRKVIRQRKKTKENLNKEKYKKNNVARVHVHHVLYKVSWQISRHSRMRALIQNKRESGSAK